MLVTKRRLNENDEPYERPQKRYATLLDYGEFQLMALPLEIVLRILNFVPRCMHGTLRCQNSILRDCVDHMLSRVCYNVQQLQRADHETRALTRAIKLTVRHTGFPKAFLLLHKYPNIKHVRLLPRGSATAAVSGLSADSFNRYILHSKLHFLDLSFGSTYSDRTSDWLERNDPNIDHYKLRFSDRVLMSDFMSRTNSRDKYYKKIHTLDLRFFRHSRGVEIDAWNVMQLSRSKNDDIATIDWVVHILDNLAVLKLDSINEAMKVSDYMLELPRNRRIELHLTLRCLHAQSVHLYEQLTGIASRLKGRHLVSLKYISPAGLVTRISTFAELHALLQNPPTRL